MSEQQNDGGRQMYQGDWKCSKCDTAITQLPFEPSPDRTDQLQCRDCFRQSKPRFNRGGGDGGFQRRTYQGDWKCSKCGTSITELPFEPHPDRVSELKCRDCFRQR
ncbi:MAG: hypothetical protein V3T98_01420 [Candidatus Paceibacterota bacterium]